MSNNTNSEPTAPANGSGFIVVWEDPKTEFGIPMSWDDSCEGAICASQEEVAVFSSRAAARRAIDISTKFAALCKAQGKPANEDFIGEVRHQLRVLPLRPNRELSHGDQKGQL
jgi:hypothetical protein